MAKRIDLSELYRTETVWTVEGCDREAVEDAARKLCGYIRRFKGHRFYA